MTDTLPDTQPDSPPPAHRSSLGLRFLLAFLLGIALVGTAGGGALYAYGQQYTGKILPGVQVGGVDLSGMAPDAARAALEEAYASLGSGRIAVEGPDGELTIGFREVGRRADVDAMLAAALAAGRQGEPIADLVGVPQAVIRGTRLEPQVTYDEAKLTDAVAAIARTVDEEPTDATLVAEKDGTFALTPGREGRAADQAALAAAIGPLMGDVDTPDEVRVTVAVAPRIPVVETAEAQAAQDAGERMAADLALTHGDESWTIPGKQLRKLVSFSPTVDGGIAPVLDVAGLDPLIEAVAGEINQKARSAALKLNGNRVVVAAGSRDGRVLDQEAARALVLDSMLARQGGADASDAAVTPAISVREPEITTAEAESWAPKMQALPKGRWTTWFQIYERNGFGANIWIPAKLINGYVVAPGATFDFWKALGPVTREKGFKQGGAIINGRTEPLGALAGGICSCSTTLFNAALRAGYKMGARRNHYYYIDRYPKGLDATVFKSDGGSTQTMSFTNDTDYPVIIRGINTRKGNIGYVTFQLYSVPNGRRVVIGPAVVKNVRQARDTTQYTKRLPKGRSERVEYPVDGMDVWRTVTVYQNGKLLRQKTYYTHYATITGLVLVGTGGSASPDPSPTPAP